MFTGSMTALAKTAVAASLGFNAGAVESLKDAGILSPIVETKGDV